MPLAPSNRQLIHTRSISVHAFRRDDGLWDLEARLVDLKSRDVPLASGIRARGMPVHDMTLCVTIDEQLVIVAAGAASDATPYPGQCEAITPSYERLVGLNLLRGFRGAVRERLGGTAGCTHLTELTAVLPTAAIQAFAGEVIDTGDGAPGPADGQAARTSRPFQIDRCHALREDGPTVREYYPTWYRAPGTNAAPSDDPSPSCSSKEPA
jgi:hypothetical protein